MQATASKSRQNSSLDPLMVASMVENLDVLKDDPDDTLKQQRSKELKMKFNSSCISSSGIYTRAGPLRRNVDTIVTKFPALPKALRDAMFSDVCARRPSHSWRWCRTVVAPLSTTPVTLNFEESHLHILRQMMAKSGPSTWEQSLGYFRHVSQISN